MNNRIVSICAMSLVGIVGLAATPSILWTMRKRQFEQTKRVVELNGGSLTFEMVEGSYDLALFRTTDEQIEVMMPYLRRLPTGFTLIGPGEDREFMLQITDSPLSDESLAKLCSLELASLSLHQCPKLTCASLSKLVQLRQESNILFTAELPFADFLSDSNDNLR